MFTALAVATGIHMALTYPAEERRRAAHLSTEHIDHTGIWTTAAALVLPVHLMTVLVVGIRVQRYLIARKPPVRVLFGTAGILASALATQAIIHSTNVHLWIIDQVRVGDLAQQAGWILVALAAYYLVQTAVLGVARGLRDRTWSWVATVGGRKENVDFVVTLCLGLLAAVASGVAGGLLLLTVSATAIVWTRSAQRIEALEYERDQLQVDALHDPLTGLANQRGFNSAAALALVADQARDRSTSVIMFDIDRFKQTNSILGHLGANEVLKGLADVLRSHLRRDDLVCRWGGEEFSVLLPSTGLPEANAIAERIRATVETMTVEITKAAGGRTELVSGFTISGGVSVAPDHGGDLTTLQLHADRALELAKVGGRNQVRIAAPLPLAELEPELKPGDEPEDPAESLWIERRASAS
jgi:diguanylate cyclase (GGDEF)-like protein